MPRSTYHCSSSPSLVFQFPRLGEQQREKVNVHLLSAKGPYDHMLHPGFQHGGTQWAFLSRAVPAPVPTRVREEDVHGVLRVRLVLFLRLVHETLDHVVVPYPTILEHLHRTLSYSDTQVCAPVSPSKIRPVQAQLQLALLQSTASGMEKL
jgi:hypothetical protein